MEPMVTISVKDYNELVRNSGDKRVLELLTIIVKLRKPRTGQGLGGTNAFRRNRYATKIYQGTSERRTKFRGNNGVD